MTTSERLLQFVDYKQISKREFYLKTGLSNGLLDKASSIGSNSLEKIHLVYPELNILWVVTGEGSMLNSSNLEHILNKEAKQPESIASQILEEMRTINEKLMAEMEFLRAELLAERSERKMLQELLGKHLASDLSVGQAA